MAKLGSAMMMIVIFLAEGLFSTDGSAAYNDIVL